MTRILSHATVALAALVISFSTLHAVVTVPGAQVAASVLVPSLA